MPAKQFNCYLCGEKIESEKDAERVARRSLILWAHPRCLKSQQASRRSAGST
jgi:hypothetical protein